MKRRQWLKLKVGLMMFFFDIVSSINFWLTLISNFAEDLIEKNAEKLPNASIKGLKETLNRSEFHKEPSVLKLDSIHIKEERFSVANKTGRFTVINKAQSTSLKHFSSN